jgi:hypothetical protein
MDQEQLRHNANTALVKGILGLPSSNVMPPNPQGVYAVYFNDMESLYPDVRVVCADTVDSTGLDKAKAMVDSAVLSGFERAGTVRAEQARDRLEKSPVRLREHATALAVRLAENRANAEKGAFVDGF